MRGLFVTGTGTGVGKTFVTRGLARALVDAGVSVAALKPIETGCRPTPEDAVALARACRRPELATATGLHRVAPPVGPYAATFEGASQTPNLRVLGARVRALAADTELALVEGAGGLLAPIDRALTIADLAVTLALPLLVVAEDGLGVVSSVLTTLESAERRSLRIGAIVLRQAPTADRDPSVRTNALILAEWTDAPIVKFGVSDDDDDALAQCAAAAGLVDLARESSATSS